MHVAKVEGQRDKFVVSILPFSLASSGLIYTALPPKEGSAGKSIAGLI